MITGTRESTITSDVVEDFESYEIGHDVAEYPLWEVKYGHMYGAVVPRSTSLRFEIMPGQSCLIQDDRAEEQARAIFDCPDTPFTPGQGESYSIDICWEYGRLYTSAEDRPFDPGVSYVIVIIIETDGHIKSRVGMTDTDTGLIAPRGEWFSLHVEMVTPGTHRVILGNEQSALLQNFNTWTQPLRYFRFSSAATTGGAIDFCKAYFDNITVSGAPQPPVDPPAPEDPVDPPAPEDPVDPPAPEDPINPPAPVKITLDFQAEFGAWFQLTLASPTYTGLEIASICPEDDMLQNLPDGLLPGRLHSFTLVIDDASLFGEGSGRIWYTQPGIASDVYENTITVLFLNESDGTWVETTSTVDKPGNCIDFTVIGPGTYIIAGIPKHNYDIISMTVPICIGAGIVSSVAIKRKQKHATTTSRNASRFTVKKGTCSYSNASEINAKRERLLRHLEPF